MKDFYCSLNFELKDFQKKMIKKFSGKLMLKRILDRETKYILFTEKYGLLPLTEVPIDIKEISSWELTLKLRKLVLPLIGKEEDFHSPELLTVEFANSDEFLNLYHRLNIPFSVVEKWYLDNPDFSEKSDLPLPNSYSENNLFDLLVDQLKEFGYKK